jgi:predicted Zn-dependent peptidase
MLDRKIPPPFKRSISFDLLQPVKLALPNGLVIHCLGGSEQDVVKIDVIFNAGRWLEKQWGLSYFTAHLLTKGTSSKSSFEIAQIFDRYGAHVEISPALDVVTLSVYSLASSLKPVLDLLIEILNDSIFPEKELEQDKSIYLQNLKINQEKTSFQASKLIRKNIFGEQHPYGKELEEVDVNQLTTALLKDFYKEYFSDYQVIVSGKVDDAVQGQIIQSLALLTKPKANEVRNISALPGNRSQFVEKAASVQASVRMGKRSLLRSDVDYFNVIFLNHILGGFFGSRLMKNIREEKGLTYGIHASIHALKNDSFLVIGADVNKENQALIFQEIRNELMRLRTELINKEELDIARYHFIGSLQSEITTPFAHAEKIRNILLYNLDQEYYSRMINKISSVSSEELIDIAEKYFNEKSFFEAAVG